MTPEEQGARALELLRELDEMGEDVDDWDDFMGPFLEWHREKVVPLLHPEPSTA